MGRVFGLLTQLVLARMYGPTQLGFYTLGFTLIQLTNILAQFGMDNAVVRYVAHYRAESDNSRVRGTILLALCVTLVLSLVLSGLIFLGADLLSNKVFDGAVPRTVFMAFSVSLPFFTVMSMALWATQGFQTVYYTAYVQRILQPLMNLIFIIVFYLLGLQILGAVVAYILSMAVGCVLALYYLKQLFPELFDKATLARYDPRAMFRVSGPLILANTTQHIYSWAAVMILGVFATASAVGIYNVAARVATFSSIVLSAFALIFAPMVSSLYRRGLLEDLNRLYKDISRWSFTGALAIFLLSFLLARDIMAIFGPRFVPGWVVLVIVAAGQLVNSSVGPTARVLSMTGHQNWIFLAMLGSAVAGVVGNVVLVPAYGILGAGIATATALLVANTVQVVLVHRLLGFLPYNRQYLRPLATGSASAAITLLAKVVLPLPGGLVSIITLTPLFLASFVVVFLILGLSTSDRQFLEALWVAVWRVAKRDT
jgi:O-antigen/teichoic acid export membrane protein